MSKFHHGTFGFGVLVYDIPIHKLAVEIIDSVNSSTSSSVFLISDKFILVT